MPRLTLSAALLAALLLAGTLSAQESRVLIYVKAPADAKLTVDGLPVKQMGVERRLITPPIRAGEKGYYTFAISYEKNGKTVTIERLVTVEGGKETRVDMTADEPKVSETPKTELPQPVAEPKKADPPKQVAEKTAVEPKSEQPKQVEPPKKAVKLDVPYVPTPTAVVEEMLKLAGVKEGDTVYDLGCGDGRIVITAVQKYKAKRGLGIELAPERVKLSIENAEKAGLKDKIEIREGDVLKLTDVSEASVVTLYLLPDINEKLKPILKKTLKPGSRVVSHDFDMGEDWKPAKEVTVKDETGREHVIYLWTIADDKKPTPAEKKDEPTIKVPYVPTPQSVVEEMCKLAGVKEGDVVYDLGCGDGRIVITAVKSYKAKKGIGVDIDPERIKECKLGAKEAKVEDKVEFREGDVLKVDSVADANVVMLYLFPEVNERLQPMLQRTLKPGARIVSHDFLMKDDWKPEKEITVKDSSGQEHTLYLWTIKEKK